MSQFVAELRRLSEHCDFKATLDDMLRDRIVCGVRNSSVQRRLLAESGLTLVWGPDQNKKCLGSGTSQ